MRTILLAAFVGVALAVAGAPTSCIVSGYEGNLVRPLAGTSTEKTVELSGPVEGRTKTAALTVSGPFDSLVWLAVDTEPGPLCSLPLGFLLMFR